MAFPITELEKPHCELTAKRSRGTKRLASWLPVLLLWTTNILETVRGFEAVALLVVPIELVGVFLARNLVGAVEERLGVR
jgi:hypothetical protein